MTTKRKSIRHDMSSVLFRACYGHETSMSNLIATFQFDSHICYYILHTSFIVVTRFLVRCALHTSTSIFIIIWVVLWKSAHFYCFLMCLTIVLLCTIKYVIWSSWISRLSPILIWRYSPSKKTSSLVSYCFSKHTFN